MLSYLEREGLLPLRKLAVILLCLIINEQMVIGSCCQLPSKISQLSFGSRRLFQLINIWRDDFFLWDDSSKTLRLYSMTIFDSLMCPQKREESDSSIYWVSYDWIFRIYQCKSLAWRCNSTSEMTMLKHCQHCKWSYSHEIWEIRRLAPA